MHIIEVPYILIIVKTIRESRISFPVFEVMKIRLIVYVCFSELSSALPQPELSDIIMEVVVGRFMRNTIYLTVESLQHHVGAIMPYINCITVNNQ